MRKLPDMDEHLAKLKYISKLINNSYYSDFEGHLIKLVRLSRNKVVLGYPKLHLDFQKSIIGILEEIEPLVTSGRKLAKDEANSDIKVQADRNRLIACMYREVADGLAWRTLGNNRVRLRILAQSQTPGFIATPAGSKVGRKAELKYAGNVASNNCFVLLHDITNLLLVGDLSMVKKIGDKPHLAEVKTKKLIAPASIVRKIDNKAKLSKQEKKLFQAQIMLEEDKVISGKDEATSYHFNSKVKHFHQDVKKIIRQARKEGFGTVSPAPYLVIEVTDFNIKTDLKVLKAKSIIKRGEHSLPFSNYDSLVIKSEGFAMRGKPPYTVYPYSAKDVVQLMMGNLYLHAVVYIDRLKEAFLAYGWEMSIDIPDDLDRKVEGQIFGSEELFTEINDDELFITFIHLETRFVIKIGMELVSKIGHEFLSVEACLAPLEARRKQVIKTGRSTSEFIYAVNDSEEKVWK
jgi:hypothetical protein